MCGLGFSHFIKISYCSLNRLAKSFCYQKGTGLEWFCLWQACGECVDSFSFIIIFKDFIYLFLERGAGRGKEWNIYL